MERERNKILVAVDGSEQTNDIIDYLSGMVPAMKTEIVLFHIMARAPDFFLDREKEPQLPGDLDHLKRWEIDREKQIRNLMRGLRSRFVEIGMPEYSAVISIQKVKEGIARDLLREGRQGYDAVVVGRGYLGARTALTLGSVAGKVAAKFGTVNLWLVGGSTGRGKILVGMDASEPALRAVRHVARMINPANQHILLVHVVRGISVSAVEKEKIFPDEYRRRLLDEAANQIKPSFDRAFEILVSAGIRPERIATKVISGVASRAGAIFDEAMREGYGTVVVGRKGLSDTEEFDMGRVTGKLVQYSSELALWIVG